MRKIFTCFFLLIFFSLQIFAQDDPLKFSLRQFYSKELEKVREKQRQNTKNNHAMAQKNSSQKQISSKKAPKRKLGKNYYTIYRGGKKFLRTPAYINKEPYLNAVQIAPAILPNGKYSSVRNQFYSGKEKISFQPGSAMVSTNSSGEDISSEMNLPVLRRGNLTYFPIKNFFSALDSLELYNVKFGKRKIFLSTYKKKIPQPEIAADTTKPRLLFPKPDHYQLPPDLVRRFDSITAQIPGRGTPGFYQENFSVRNILGDSLAQVAQTEKEKFLSGFVDAYYSYNFSLPQSRANGPVQLNQFANQFSLNLVKIELQRKPEPFGYAIDLTWGSAAEFLNANDPSYLRFLLQAFASFRTGDVEADLGKFKSHIGSEVPETNHNANYSRSYIFVNTPFTHTGARVKYQPARSFSVMGMIANGWDRIIENNSGKTFGAQLMLSPVENFSVLLNGITGPERNVNSSDYRSTGNVILDWQIEPLGLNIDYVYTRENFSLNNASWTGISAIARIKFTDEFATALRAEFFDDANGIATGTAQNLREVTLTGDYRPAKKILLRGEFRRDWSDKAFFEASDGSGRFDQNIFTIGAVFEF